MTASSQDTLDSHVSDELLKSWLAATEKDLELHAETMRHLDLCETCRSRMESLAAPIDWWNRTSGYLAEWVDPANTSPKEAIPFPITPKFMPNQFLESPVHPEMLGRLDHFDIEEVIGQGGMGIVFRGFDRELNRAVAVKFLAPHLAANGTARQRFAREARAAAAIVHPNVVPIHAIAGTDHPYLVMALIGGPSLEKLVADQGPLDPVDVVRIGMQIAAGLEAAHRQGLVHRDIKPSNILLDGDAGRVFITDFGLARAADDVAVTQTGWLAGTPHYMSPEQTLGSDLDGRSDLFSLGSVLYFLATGREPFRADKPLAVLQKISHESPTHPAVIQPRIPDPLARLILTLLEKDPTRRFQSAQAVFIVLEKYLAHLQHPQTCRCPTALRQPLWGLPLRSWRRIGIVVGCLLLGGGLSFPFWNRQGTGQAPAVSYSVPAPRDTTDPQAFGDLQPWNEFKMEVDSLEESIRQMESTLGIIP